MSNNLITTSTNLWGEFKGKNFKELSLGNSAKLYLDLNSGKTTAAFTSFTAEDFALPLTVTHLHSKISDLTNYGRGWRLNLQKKLKVSGNDGATDTKYTYTDEFGDEYELEEKYYYMQNGSKVFVNKDSVEIDLNGNLHYTLNGEEYEVKKQQFCNGYTLIPEINDFKNFELIEQKRNEQVELENFVNSYEPSLKNYVKVNSLTGEIAGRMNSLNKSEYETLVKGITTTSDNVIMSESEALQLKSLYSSLEQLNLQNLQCEYQQSTLLIQRSQLDLQLEQIRQQVDDMTKLNEVTYKQWSEDINDPYTELAYHKEASEKNCNFARQYFTYHSNEKNMDLLMYAGDSEDGELHNQYEINREQRQQINGDLSANNKQQELFNKQKAFVQTQISYLISQARSNLNVVKDTFIKYFTKKAQLDLLVLQTPVNYLKDSNGIISGFNKEGDLVCIFDSFGNSVALEYDAKKLVVSAYDSNNKTVKFGYANGMLSIITDNLGRSVKFGYDGAKLITVAYPDGNVLTISYSSDRLGSFTYSEGIQYKMSYTDGLFTRVLTKRIQPVENTASEIKVSYLNGSVTIDYDTGYQEYYRFSEDKRLSYYYELDGARLGTYTTYTYKSDSKTIIKETRKDTERGYDTVTTKYNDFDLRVSESVDWNKLSDNVKVKTDRAYEYDSDNKLIRVSSTRYIDNLGTVTEKHAVTNYNYNAQGALVLIESYIIGEENESGKNFEQRFYDKNGNVVKTVKWNSLDSSAKFYSESVTAENGQVTAEKDGTGETCAEYEYIDGTNVVNSVKYSNGSKLSYGRNPYNMQVTSVTQSTEDGIANQTDIEYEYGMPVKVKSGNTEIIYSYDEKGRKTGVVINGEIHSNYSYEDFKEVNPDEVFLGKTSQTLLENGDAIKSVLTKEGVSDGDSGNMCCTETFVVGKDTLYIKNYDEYGLLEKLTYKDGTDKTVQYSYNLYRNLTSVQTSDTDVIMTENYTYDDYGALIKKEITGEANQTYTFEYKPNAARDLLSVGFGAYKFKPLSDVYGRNTGKEISNGANKLVAEYISYRKVGDHATNMPATVWYASGTTIKDSIKYTYDKCGNIASITENGHIIAKYTYDSLNRLIREDNKPLNKTKVYSYDTNGNITERCEYAYTSKTGEELSELECAHYSYDYIGDRLVNYNGETFAYNSLGNPTEYRGKNVSWQYGKRLVDFGGTTFTYDGLGRRTSKNGIRFIYDNEGRLIKQSDGLEFVYDNAGIIGVKYNDTQYFYRKDAQGNIIAILDNSGAVVVEYVYDAWGNHAVKAEEEYLPLANANPFRYRGYYYDTETGLYYLLTRYYDPEIGRFISQDSIEYADPETINGLNLYSYCGNNPVMYIDSNGRAPLPLFESFVGLFKDISAILGKTFINLGAKAFAGLSNLPMYLLDDVGGAVFNPAYAKGLDSATNLDYWGKVLGAAGKVLNVLSYVLLAIDCGLAIYNNVTNPNLSTDRKITDSIFDVGYSLLSFGLSSASVALGSLIFGPVGAVIGAAFGLGIGILFWGFQTYCSDLYNQMKIGFNTFITKTIPDAWNNFVNGLEWFFSFSWAK